MGEPHSPAVAASSVCGEWRLRLSEPHLRAVWRSGDRWVVSRYMVFCIRAKFGEPDRSRTNHNPRSRRDRVGRHHERARAHQETFEEGSLRANEGPGHSIDDVAKALSKRAVDGVRPYGERPRAAKKRSSVSETSHVLPKNGMRRCAHFSGPYSDLPDPVLGCLGFCLLRQDANPCGFTEQGKRNSQRIEYHVKKRIQPLHKGIRALSRLDEKAGCDRPGVCGRDVADVLDAELACLQQANKARLTKMKRVTRQFKIRPVRSEMSTRPARAVSRASPDRSRRPRSDPRRQSETDGPAKSRSTTYGPGRGRTRPDSIAEAPSM